MVFLLHEKNKKTNTKDKNAHWPVSGVFEPTMMEFLTPHFTSKPWFLVDSYYIMRKHEVHVRPHSMYGSSILRWGWNKEHLSCISTIFLISSMYLWYVDIWQFLHTLTGKYLVHHGPQWFWYMALSASVAKVTTPHLTRSHAEKVVPSEPYSSR